MDHIPTIPPTITLQHLDEWSQELGISMATIDAVIGKAPGTFHNYLEGKNLMKHKDFETLQDYLRIRSEALRKA